MKYNKKRALSLLLALSMTASLLSVGAFAAEEVVPEPFPETAGVVVEQERPEEPEDAAPVQDGEETQTPEEEPAPKEEVPAEVPEEPAEFPEEAPKTPEEPDEEESAAPEEAELSQPKEEAEPEEVPEEPQPEPPVVEAEVPGIKVPEEDLSEAALPEIIEPDLALMGLALQVEEPGLQELVEAGGLVRLGRDYTESITVTGDVTLNLNGHTLTNTPGQHTITVAPGGSLTITGYGTVDNESHGMSAVYNEGSVVLTSGIYDRSLEKGTLSGESYSTVDGGNSAATLYNDGDMTIWGTVRVQQAGGVKTNEYGYRGFHSPLISNWGELTITGGEFYGGKNNIKNESGADLEISDGAFHENLGFSLWNGGAARISGGSFTSWNAAAVWNQGSELVITGGTFTAVDRDGQGKRATIESSGSSTAQILGGHFGNELVNYNKDNKELNGLLPETVLLVKDSSGTFLVRPRTKADGDTEAAIGDACYSSLPAAIRAAKPGDEVVLLRDYAKDLYKGEDGKPLLTEGKDLTLNLGEKQIKGYLVNGGAGLTIKATTGGVNGAGKPYAIFNAKGTLTLEGGIYTSDGQYGVRNAGGLTINGGEITAQECALQDESAGGTQLAVNGGTLRGGTGAVQSNNNTGFIAGGLFSHDVTSYCAPGLKAEGPNGAGLWEVLADQTAAAAQVGGKNYLTLRLAIQAAQDGETVLLLKSVEETVSLSKTLTLDLNGYTVTGQEADYTVTVAEGGSLTITGAGGIHNSASDRGAVYNLGQLRVESGTFSSAAAGYALLNAGMAEVVGGTFQTQVENGEAGRLTIRGGSFAHPVDPVHCAPGFLPVVNGNVYGVLEAALSVTLDRTTGSLNTGSTLGLTATVHPENVTLDKTVTWSSDNEGVATVNAEGLVTAVAAGTANITAAVGEARAICVLTVTRQSTSGGSTGGSTGGSGGGSGNSAGGGPAGGESIIQPPVENIDEEQTPLSGKPFLFEDVAQTDWFYEAVKYVFDHDIMEGVTETLFQPYGDTTRGMIVTMLYRAEGSPEAGEAPFTDVPAEEWYSAAVAWAAENDVVKGYEDGTFAPEKRITREELSAILYRYAALKGYDVTANHDLAGFAETDQISAWAVESVRWAVASGLIQGKESGRLDPTGTTSRSEAAAILTRFHQAHNA